MFGACTNDRTGAVFRHAGNDLFWPLIATTDPQLATPPRGILYFRDEESGDDVGPLMAAALIITAPLVIAFLLAQRKFTQGLAASGLK